MTADRSPRHAKPGPPADPTPGYVPRHASACSGCGAQGFRLTDGRCDGCEQEYRTGVPTLTAAQYVTEDRCAGWCGDDDCTGCEAADAWPLLAVSLVALLVVIGWIAVTR